MLSLYIENSVSCCMILLLIWYDFSRNIPCLCYSITGSPCLKSSRFSPYSIFVLKFLLFTFCQSRSTASCQLANLARLFPKNSCRNLTITSPLLWSTRRHSRNSDTQRRARHFTQQTSYGTLSNLLFHILRPLFSK